MVDESDFKIDDSEKKSKKEILKQFLDVVFLACVIFGLYLWYVGIDYPEGIIPANLAIISIFLTPVFTAFSITLIIFSIIRHKEEIKKIYNKPKKAIEYAIDPDNSHSDLLFSLFSFLLSMYLVFFLIEVPAEESIKNIPWIGDNLKIFNDMIDEFSALHNQIFSISAEGVSILDISRNFAEKMVVFSILLSFGPTYFLALRLFRMQYLHEKKTDHDIQDKHKKKKEFPGVGSLVVFIFVVLALLSQKIILDPNEFANIGIGWIFPTMIFGAIPLIVMMFLSDKITKKLIKK